MHMGILRLGDKSCGVKDMPVDPVVCLRINRVRKMFMGWGNLQPLNP